MEIKDQINKSPYNQSVDDLFKILNSTKEGLKTTEIELIKAKTGLNQIPKIKISFFQKYIKPVVNLMMILLLLTSVIQIIFFKKLFSPIIILSVVIINFIIAMRQQYKAEKTLEALERLTSYKATVLRDNSIIEINPDDLVPGDILLLNQGDFISADARIFKTNDLKIDESVLTGEPYPIKKNANKLDKQNLQIQEQVNMLFSSTFVVSGNGKAVVTATGTDSEIGKISKGIAQKKYQEIPLNKSMNKLATGLGLLVLSIVVILFIIAIIQGVTDIVNELNWLIALAVAAIPINFPLIATLILLTGVIKLSHNQAIVRDLNAVETMGRLNYICSDKTGTITENEMTVQKIFYNNRIYEISGQGYDYKGEILLNGESVPILQDQFLHKLLINGIINNNAFLKKEQFMLKNGTSTKNRVIGLPTEGCLITLAKKGKINVEFERKRFQILKEYTFSSQRKKMSKIVELQKKLQCFSKGAPEKILDICSKIALNNDIIPLTEAKKIEIKDQVDIFAKEGFRTLAFAFKNINKQDIKVKFPEAEEMERELTFLGITAMHDPVREGVRESIKLCQNAGIKVTMITGDHPSTAKSIAKEINIYSEGDSIITGNEIDSLSPEQIAETCVFARVSPEDKNTIIQGLKSRNKIVAMTGDGVNDAIALENADVGIAMGIKGTDVAKNAADLILTDDSFNTIERALYHGRGLFNNIQSNVVFLLVCDLTELLVLTLISLLFNQRIFEELHLYILYALPHFFFPLGLIFDSYDADIMKDPPKKKNEPLINKNYIKMMIFQIGIITTVVVLIWVLIMNDIYPIYSENYTDPNFINPISHRKWIGYNVGPGEYIIFSNSENLDLLKIYKAQTICFINLVFSEIWMVFEARSLKNSMFKRRKNRILFMFVIFVLCIIFLLLFYDVTQSYLHFIVLSPLDWVIAIGSSFSIIFGTELLKIFKRKSK